MQTSSASLDLIAPHSGVTLPDTSPLTLSDSAPISHDYKIENILESESAWVLFTQHSSTLERFVMKVLRNYQDTRYSLETIAKRQQCQLEALRRNRIYTPEVYLGLARIIDYPAPYHICLGEPIKNPTQDMLDPTEDYVLLMHQLPDSVRLDFLLRTSDIASVRCHAKLLTEYCAYMHTHLTPSFSYEEASHWGSYEQLYDKLLQNLEILDLVPTISKYSHRIWSKEKIDCLKQRILQLFLQPQYRNYFEQRIRTKHIKSCHGDIKSPNIWIVPDSNSQQCIKILDAIDFNSLFSNIDILSDFAMLVIDIQTRTQSPSLANAMIDHYLQLTGQDDKIARAVIGYYLVEKAIVGTAISIVYDDLPDLGSSLLEVAEMRVNCLANLWR